jgi:hypothetical protein
LLDNSFLRSRFPKASLKTLKTSRSQIDRAGAISG